MKKKVMRIIFAPFIVMIAGYLLLVLVNLLPTNLIMAEVADSAEILSAEGTYPSGYLSGWFLDNWTDADCLSIVFNKSSSNPFFNALNAFQLGSADSYAGSIEGLTAAVNGDGVNTGDHSYLWNGFQIWLRPLLLRYNITEIRGLLYLVNIILIVITCVLIDKVSKNFMAFLPFIIAFSFFNFQMESLSLMFFSDLFISLAGSICILWMTIKDKEKNYEILFSVLGAYVAFSSMLITPLITLSFPLIIALLYSRSTVKTWKRAINYTMSWMASYGITMIAKITLSLLFINSKGGLNQLLTYSGQGSYTIFERFNKVLDVFTRAVLRSKIETDLIVVLMLAILIYILIRKRNNLRLICEIWPLLVIACYPVVWCFVCAGHAGHGWTCWNFSISIFAILEVLFKIADFKTEVGSRKQIK